MRKDIEPVRNAIHVRIALFALLSALFLCSRAQSQSTPSATEEIQDYHSDIRVQQDAVAGDWRRGVVHGQGRVISQTGLHADSTPDLIKVETTAPTTTGTAKNTRKAYPPAKIPPGFRLDANNDRYK
jgi:hypothetical protein